MFLHSNELDDSPVTDLDSFSFQYRIDPGSPVSLTPFANLRVNNAAFGNRTLVFESTPGVVGSFATVTVATGSDNGWVFNGHHDRGHPGRPARRISVVTGLSDGAGWVGWA